MSQPVLKVDDLHVRFDRGGRRVNAVNGLSYQLQAGRTLAIVGESGSGKTVSSRALMGLLPPTATVTGSARIDGVELVGLPEEEMRHHRGADIAMVFQDPTRSLNPTMRIGTQITEAVRAHTRVEAPAAKRRALELLSLVRIPDPQRRFHQYPHQLSGGMRQRIMIAIALAADPKVLIADEATTALDVTTQAQIMIRCRMPPESWCGYSWKRRCGSAIRTSDSSSSARCLARGPDRIVGADGLGDLRADAHGRIQRAGRILEDHRDVRAPVAAHLVLGHAHQFHTVDPGRPGHGRGSRQQAHQRPRTDRLARPGLPDDGQRPAGPQLVGQPVDRVHPRPPRSKRTCRSPPAARRHSWPALTRPALLCPLHRARMPRRTG